MADPTGGVFKIAHTVRLGKWAQAPCHRCHRQPKEGEVVQLDWMAQIVLCARCVNEDTTQIANALGRALERLDGEARDA
jgi:hypothetical protein